MIPAARVRMRVPMPAENASLCDLLDGLLDTGVVVCGELTITVADIELIYVGLELVASSWETAANLSSPKRANPGETR